MEIGLNSKYILVLNIFFYNTQTQIDRLPNQKQNQT